MAAKEIRIRVTDEERARWQACADRSGQSLASWLTNLATSEARREAASRLPETSASPPTIVPPYASPAIQEWHCRCGMVAVGLQCVCGLYRNTGEMMD